MGVDVLVNSMACAFCVITPGLIPLALSTKFRLFWKLAPLLPYFPNLLQRNGFNEGAVLPLLSPVVPITVGS